MYFDEKNNYFDIVSSENEYEYDIDKFTNKLNNTSIDIGNMIFNRHNMTATDPVIGFNRGNMFDNLYSKYKNHVYNLSVNNKKDELLYKIQVLGFAIKDINLYLDLHPTETRMINTIQKYKSELDKLKKEYDKLYSPLCIEDVSSTVKWTWIDNPWPWDKGGNI